MKILLLSAYDAGSHKHWRNQLISGFPQAEFTVLSLPGRYFSWRIRGNALSWSQLNQDVLNQPYDLLLATSMVDLATLRGLIPALGQIPAVLYFHENQFAYPKSDLQHKSLEPAMVNLYSALAADKLLFNSQFNRDSFIQGVDSLLKKLPDYKPSSLAKTFKDKSQIIPVPIEQPTKITQQKSYQSDQPLKLLWNHRWEYDKGPDRLYYFLRHLSTLDIQFEIAIVGESFRNSPKIFNKIKQEFSDYITQWGYLSNYDDYLNLLGSSHIVLSTAIHEFQGLAVLEAVSRGCIPLVPNRLAYQEIFPNQFCYPVAEQEEDEAIQMVVRLQLWLQSPALPDRPDISDFFWSSLSKKYSQALNLAE